MRNYILVCAAALCVAFASCSGRVTGALHEDGSAELALKASVEPRMTALIRALSRLNNPTASTELILNGPKITASLSAAPGVKAVSFSNTTPSGIEGTLSFTRIDAFLESSGNQGSGKFITYEQAAGGGRFTMLLNRATVLRLVRTVSPDVASYLEALMAPVITGETMTKPEYLALVRSVYGKPIADEINDARIQVEIDFPRNIDTIQRGNISRVNKNRGEFNVPLIDLLVLEAPLVYEATWK